MSKARQIVEALLGDLDELNAEGTSEDTYTNDHSPAWHAGHARGCKQGAQDSKLDEPNDIAPDNIPYTSTADVEAYITGYLNGYDVMFWLCKV